MALEAALYEARSAIQERDEKIAILESRLSPEENVALEAANNDRALIKTLKSQVNEWQSKHAAATRSNRALKSSGTKKDKQIETLKAQLEKAKGGTE